MFSSIAQMFKQQQNGQQNNLNFKNADLQRTTFDFDKLTGDLGANLLNNYNSRSFKQIMNGQNANFLTKDFTSNLGKTSIRLDDKETYRKMLNSSNQKTSQTKIINEITKNFLSQNTSTTVKKPDFSFLLKKNDASVKNNWYNQATTTKPENKTTNQLTTLYKPSFKVFDNLTPSNNFPYGKRISLLEKLKKIDEKERTNFHLDRENEYIDLENESNNDLNNVIQRNLLYNKPFNQQSQQQMEYDDNHFGNISKGTSSLCISEPWEDLQDEMEIDDQTNQPLSKLTKQTNFTDKSFADKIAKKLEEVNLEQNRILKEKENKYKEVEGNIKFVIIILFIY